MKTNKTCKENLSVSMGALEDQDYLRDMKAQFLADFNPVPIDDRLLEAIEDGDVALSDPLFFELIMENVTWLSTKPFLKKISEWQFILGVSTAGTCFGAGMSSPEESEKAKQNLFKIGKALAHEGQGRPREMDDTVIYLRYKQLKDGITAFFDEQGVKSTSRLMAFRKAFPQYSDYFDLKGKRHPNTPEEIAIRILIKKYGWSERNIRKAMSKHKLMKNKSDVLLSQANNEWLKNQNDYFKNDTVLGDILSKATPDEQSAAIERHRAIFKQLNPPPAIKAKKISDGSYQ